MWIPESSDALEAAVANRAVEETSQLDFKRGLPQTKGNADIAVDVAAMTVDGGVLVYGVGEDDDGHPTELAPIELAGARERIDQVVRSSIQETPSIRIDALALGDDPARGYLVVVVPPSPRAPHQVTVSGKYQYRYYGRGPTGNRILTEADVARLYARREAWTFDRRSELEAVVGRSPFDRTPSLGFLHAFVRPVVVDDDRWTQAANGDAGALQQQMLAAARRANQGLPYDPAIADASAWKRHGADTWRLDVTGPSREADETARCDVSFAGNGRLFCGRAAAKLGPGFPAPEGQLVIFEQIVAGSLASFFAVLSTFYDTAGYLGPVDVGIALTRIAGARGLSVVQGGGNLGGEYPDEDYLTDLRVTAHELADPRELTRRAVGRFFDALVRPGFDPFLAK